MVGNKIKNGVIWSVIGQFGYLGVSLLANIIIARLLSPAEFGQLGIVLFFISIARVLTDSGLGGALIRNNKASDIDYSTIFIFNLIVSVLLCLVIILFSGQISIFYDDPVLKDLLIVASFILIINAFQFVQGAKLVKNMRFKEKAMYEFIAIVISTSIGIFLVLNDYGIWSLIVMQLTTALVITILFWVFEGGHGSLKFSKESFYFHYRFGANTTIASILNSIFNNIYIALLGKYFSVTETGLYFQAKKLQEIPVGVINKLTQGVLFSGLSKIQDDKIQFKKMYQMVIRLFTVLVGLISLILFIFSEEIIFILIGKQWVEASFFLKVLAVIGFFHIQEKFNRVLFKVFNDTKYILYLELIKKSIQIVSIVIGLSLQRLDVLMYGFIVTSVISYFINFYFTYKKYNFLGLNELVSVFKVLIVLVITTFVVSNISITDLYWINLILKIMLTFILFIIGTISVGLLNVKGDMKFLKKKNDK